MSENQLKIFDLPQNAFNALCNSLDINSAWRHLVATLSDTRFKLRDIEREECSTELHRSFLGSPSKRLMEKLDSKGMSLQTLSYYLDIAKLERCLKYIRQYEPLEIVEHPVDRLEILEGTKVKLSCKARGFPYPEYVWFRGDEEVWNCADGEFSIKTVLKNDEGVYTCRVQHYAGSEGGWLGVLSEGCKVTVKKCNNFVPFNPVNLLKFNSEKNIPTPDPPQILVQPTSQTNSLGGVVIFRVEVQHHSLPLSFQWFRNRTPINRAIGNEYSINDVSKAAAGEYQVRVYAAQYRGVEVMSNVAILTIINKPNQFFATDKIALLLGNSSYRSYGSPLPAVKEDMMHTNNALEMMGFKVMSLLDLTLTEMEHYLNIFCALVSEGVYVVFYCIGHGFLHDHQHYLIPWDASQGVEVCESLCIEACIQRIQQRNPVLLMALLDVCRKKVELSSASTATTTHPPSTHSTMSRPNQVIIYAASLGEQSFEVKSQHKPRGLFNECLLDVLERNNLTFSDLYGELKKRFKDCPFDLDDEKFAQHSEMNINLEDPDRSLRDPIDQRSAVESSVLNGQFWHRIQTLPSNFTFQIENKGSISVSFKKFFSNVVALETEFCALKSQYSDVAIQIDISKDCVDPILLPIQKRKTEAKYKQIFLFHNLQRLKEEMRFSLTLTFKMAKNGAKVGGEKKDPVFHTEVIEAGFPLISSKLTCS